MSETLTRIEGMSVAITGASSGIGAATAQLLASRGAHVVLGARRTDRLEQIAVQIRAAGGSVDVVAVDVAIREQVDAFIEQACRHSGHIDVLINNAGVMPLSRLDRLLVDEWERTIDVNVKGTLYGIAACLPRMKAQGHGHLINVASIGAHQVFPGCAAYCASKYAVWAIGEALRQEEVDSGLRVTTVSPGTVESELADSITDADAAQTMRAFRSICITPDAIARAIVYAIEQPSDVSVSELIVRPTRSPY